MLLLTMFAVVAVSLFQHNELNTFERRKGRRGKEKR